MDGLYKTDVMVRTRFNGEDLGKGGKNSGNLDLSGVYLTVVSTGCANTFLGIAWLSGDSNMSVDQYVKRPIAPDDPNSTIMEEVAYRGTCSTASCVVTQTLTYLLPPPGEAVIETTITISNWELVPVL